MEEKKTLGEVIKEYRDKNKVSQTKFAKKCGLSKAYIGILEKNIRPDTGNPPIPSLETVIAVAKAIEADTFQLMRDIGIDIREKEKEFELPSMSKDVVGITPFKDIPLNQETLIEAYKERRVLLLPFRLPSRGSIVYVPSVKYGMPISCLVHFASGGVFTAESEVTGKFDFSLYDIGHSVYTDRRDAMAAVTRLQREQKPG